MKKFVTKTNLSFPFFIPSGSEVLPYDKNRFILIETSIDHTSDQRNLILNDLLFIDAEHVEEKKVKSKLKKKNKSEILDKIPIDDHPELF